MYRYLVSQQLLHYCFHHIFSVYDLYATTPHNVAVQFVTASVCAS